MRYISSMYNFQMTPFVKLLAITTTAVWFFSVVVFQQHFLESPRIFEWFGLVPQVIFDRWWIWQFFTYMFIHSPGIFHILLNMFLLWMFGSELERLWGGRFFLLYYLFCGVGAGLIYFSIVGLLHVTGMGVPIPVFETPVVGASGAIFGLLLAYGIIYSERVIYFMMIFPIKAKHFTILLAAIELVSMLNHGLGSPVANLAHLGGLVSGLIFLKGRQTFQRIIVKRWRKKGRVHLKIVNSDDNTWH